MSYLPRMSKTYKEPQAQNYEDSEENSYSYTNLQPASSLLNERTNNPQTTLRHYRYLPHPPPVLPGPSLLAEATENEQRQEISKSRRSSIKVNVTPVPTQLEFDTEPTPDTSEVTVIDKKSVMIHDVKRTQSKKTLSRSKSNLGKKKSSSKNLTDRKKPSTSKTDHVTVNLCLVEPGLEKSFTSAQIVRNEKDTDTKLQYLSKEKNSLAVNSEKSNLSPESITKILETPTSTTKNFQLDVKKYERKPKESAHKSVQCTIFRSSEKIIVIPSIVNCLLRTLAFLLHELNREESITSTTGEKKRLMTQVQLILGDLCAQYKEKDFGFDTTYSDSKRMEKILGDLQKYIKDIYGSKDEYIDKTEEMKKIFVNLKKKELELALLTEKLQENEAFQIQNPEFKDSDFKNPEITLQNKRLENEQLSAEVEFSFRELTNYQKTIAEIDWEIKSQQDQVTALKKSLAAKTKTEALGRKISNEVTARKTKSKESDEGGKRNT